jgi:hypothetical protein
MHNNHLNFRLEHSSQTTHRPQFILHSILPTQQSPSATAKTLSLTLKRINVCRPWHVKYSCGCLGRSLATRECEDHKTYISLMAKGCATNETRVRYHRNLCSLDTNKGTHYERRNRKCGKCFKIDKK